LVEIEKMSISNLEQLESVLKKLLMPDSKVIKDAEAVLKVFTSSPNCILPLFTLLTKPNEVSTGVRHMASIIVRHKMEDFWSKLDDNTHEGLKNGLLEVLVKEPQTLVRNSIMRVIGIIAESEVPSDSWPNLSKFIWGMVSSNNASQREIGLILTSFLFENIGEELI
jgi:hypothetical protein